MEISKTPDDIALLKALSAEIGVSGFEGEVCSWYIHNIKDYSDQTHTDTMGNAYALVRGIDSTGANIMLEAHADEIGFQVLHISSGGYLYLRRNGGVDEQCVPGLQVVVLTRQGERIPGIIGKKPIHLMSTDDRKRTYEISQLWVDTGLSPEEVKAKVSVGDVVAPVPNWQLLGDNRISGKSLDNKLGIFVLTKVMRFLQVNRPMCASLTGVATVQEEVGSRGAVVAGYRVNPDIAITVDLDFATDVPDCSPSKYGNIELGGGAVIPLNVDCDPSLSRELEQLAKRLGIPHQMSARPHATGGTNISRLQLSREGTRAISLGIPCRYMHTPVELCDLRDVYSAINLITNFCLTKH